MEWRAAARSVTREVSSSSHDTNFSGVDAVRVVALAYEIYSNPSHNKGVLGATLTLYESFLDALLVRSALGRRAAAFLFSLHQNLSFCLRGRFYPLIL